MKCREWRAGKWQASRKLNDAVQDAKKTKRCKGKQRQNKPSKDEQSAKDRTFVEIDRQDHVEEEIANEPPASKDQAETQWSQHSVSERKAGQGRRQQAAMTSDNNHDDNNGW